MNRMLQEFVKTPLVLLLCVVMLVLGGCRSGEKTGSEPKSPPPEGPTSSAPADTATSPAGGGPPPSASFDTPEGTVATFFQALQSNNPELYRSCFLPDTDGRAFAKRRFAKMSKRILERQMVEVPGLRKVSDTEAVFKINNVKKNRVREIKLRKVDNKWLIVPWKGEH